MKSSKIWKIVWVSGIYANLLVLLYLVVTYKVKWEDMDLNTYLYFYDCGNELCSSTNKMDDYYSKIVCEDDICPYIDRIIDKNLILKKDNSSYIYNYISGNIVNNKYFNYRYLGNNNYVVNDEDNNYGVIDDKGNILVDLEYSYIDDYHNGIISYIKDNMYGIMDMNNNKNISPRYDDVVLINDKIFAGKSNNEYQMHSYDDVDSSNSNIYDYVFADNGAIFVIKDKVIDILDENLNSVLLMKINTYYRYTIGQERDSLDIHSDGEYIYFKVFLNETEYTTYKYDINEKKII